MTKQLLILWLFILAAFPANAQQKPLKPTQKAPIRKTVPTKKATVTPNENHSKLGNNDTQSASVKRPSSKDTLVVDDYGKNSESLENLKKIEAENNALLAGETQEATYHRMDRNSLTVIPVQLFVPGLGKVDEKTKKPIYTRKELFDARKVKSHAGDVLVSEKYFYNKVRFDAGTMLTDILSDSIAFYAMFDLKPPQRELVTEGKIIPKINIKKDPVEEETKAAIAAFKAREKEILRDYLTNGNVGTDILKIWSNRTVLMERLYYSVAEVDKRENVDPKKYKVFQNLLRKNYVLFLLMVNPEKVVERRQNGTISESYQAQVEGLLFHVDTTNLDGNNIQPKHPLQFVERVSFGSMVCDPVNEGLAEAYGTWSNEGLWKKSNTLRLASIRKQAQAFYQNKDYPCAKNYYEFVMKAGIPDADKEKLKALILECENQLAKSPSTQDAPPCLIDESGLYEDWIFAQGATNRVMTEMERKVDIIQTKSFIFKTDPYITAEIGKKEGVYTDERFRVYRKAISAKGKVGEKRIATLRVIKVANNTTKFDNVNLPKSVRDSSKVSITSLFASSKKEVPATSKPKPSAPSMDDIQKQKRDSLVKQDLNTMSMFKQVDGERIMPYDLVRQNEDRGFGVQVGYGSRLGSNAFIAGLDYRISSLFKVPGLKLGLNIGIPNSEEVSSRYDIPEDEITMLDIYIGKDLYLSRKYDVRPLAGVSVFNEKAHFMLGVMGYLNLIGKSSNTKVKLAPEVSYVVGYAPQASLNLRFEF